MTGQLAGEEKMLSKGAAQLYVISGLLKVLESRRKAGIISGYHLVVLVLVLFCQSLIASQRP